jgi:hypothetical protein
VGNAISRGNPELEALLEKKLPYVSMAEMLKREVIQGKRSFVVSGTHGKTTTTTMLAWIFEHAGKDPGFMIGGVPENFESGARFTHSNLFVIEGDEYDTAYFDKRSKFLHYLPECAIVNNIEFDHADIFPRSRRDPALLSALPEHGAAQRPGADQWRRCKLPHAAYQVPGTAENGRSWDRPAISASSYHARDAGEHGISRSTATPLKCPWSASSTRATRRCACARPASPD